MANIRNSISLTDRMTPTLRSILKAMDSTLRVMKQLDKASNKGVQSKAFKRAEKDIRRANNELIKMRNYTKLAGNAARDSEKAYSRMGSAAGSVANGMKAIGNSATYFLQSLASGVYLAQKLANAVEGIMTTADTSRSQVARLGLYNTSDYTNEELYGQVFATAMNTRSELSNTANMTNKLLISGVFDGDSAVQSAINTAGLINKILVAGGGTSEENNRAVTQLMQGLASGALQGDELRSIREQVPYLAQVMAEGLAQVDEQFAGIGIGDLKQLGADGELTADRIVKAFWAMQDEVNSDFEAMPKTFGQAMTSMGSIWQYFLWMLSDAEGPLGKINDKLWQFVDYLQSPQGLELLETVAIGINFIATALSVAMGAIGEFVVFLQENAYIAQALFIALGVAAATSGITAAISWIAACWPILLIMALVFLVAQAFLAAGYTAQEVVGAIVGGVLWLVAVIWYIIIIIVTGVMWLGIIILEAIIGLILAICLIIMGIIQVVLWVVYAIVAYVWLVWTMVKTVGLLFKAGIQTVARFILDKFHNMIQGILDDLRVVAEAIDSVFGTDTAGTIDRWSGNLERTYTTVMDWIGDPDNTMEDVKQMWTDYGDGVKELFTSDKYNMYNEMGDTWDTTTGNMKALWGAGMEGDAALYGAMWNPADAYDSGNAWGAGVVDEVGGLKLGIPDSSVLGAFNPDGVTVEGGYLDGIKSDVDISEEDLQLLRDMTARDYLLQLQTITPVANVTFGDVRETADVSKIVEVIEQMVEEQMATSLVS